MEEEHSLDIVMSDDDWREYHAIRKAVLFAEGRQSFEYDSNHPDEHVEGNYPLLLRFNGEAVGTVRLDIKDGFAVTRLVSVKAELQGRGHGCVLMEMVEMFAQAYGAEKLVVNADVDAVGFYEKCGFVRQEWDSAELVGIAEECSQMVKVLH